MEDLILHHRDELGEAKFVILQRSITDTLSYGKEGFSIKQRPKIPL